MTLEVLADNYAVAYSEFVLYGAQNNVECVARERALHEGIAAAIKAEREACAKLCDELDDDPDHLHPNDCADAIRLRSNV